MFNIAHNAIYNHISSFTSFLFHSQMTITSLKCIMQPVPYHLLAGHSLNAVVNNAKLKHTYKVFSKLISSFPLLLSPSSTKNCTCLSSTTRRHITHHIVIYIMHSVNKRKIIMLWNDLLSNTYSSAFPTATWEPI